MYHCSTNVLGLQWRPYISIWYYQTHYVFTKNFLLHNANYTEHCGLSNNFFFKFIVTHHKVCVQLCNTNPESNRRTQAIGIQAIGSSYRNRTKFLFLFFFLNSFFVGKQQNESLCAFECRSLDASPLQLKADIGRFI